MGGLSIANQIGNYIIRGATGFTWSDADAEGYYDSLAVANGGDIDASLLYSIPLDDLKSLIDDSFINLKADGVYSSLGHWYPIIGGTAATHAISAISTLSELTFVGSPTHGASGVTTNGSTQHIDTGTNPATFSASRYDGHISFWNKNIVNGLNAAGSRTTSAVSFWSRVLSSTTFGGALVGGATNGVSISPNEMFHANIVGNSVTDDRSIYQNGSTITNSAPSAGGDVSTTTVFSSWNNGGSVINKVTGDFIHGSLGSGMSDAEATDFNTTISNIQTTLGR